MGARRHTQSAEGRSNKRSYHTKYDLLINFPTAQCAWVLESMDARRRAQSAERKLNKRSYDTKYDL